MKYSQVVAYLQDAMVLGSVPGLDTVTSLLDEIGNPHKNLVCVHVAGTNGKGSTCSFIAEILRQAGYKVGLYTSPYICDFSERIQVDGQPISNEDIGKCGEKVILAAEAIVAKGFAKPTVFELTTAMGFDYFKNSGCDIVVLEVGLGGRLDATNVIDNPEVSVICRIGLDHTEVLGDTLEEIAMEKAGIIKSGRPVVLSGQGSAISDAILAVCANLGCTLTIADASIATEIKSSPNGLVFNYGRYGRLRSGLFGLYQLGNAITAIETTEVLRTLGWKISDEALRKGLEGAYITGRLEMLSRSPLFFADGAHNPQGARALSESLRAAFPGKKFLFITGVLADKDYRGGISELKDLAKRFYTVTPPIPRALSSDDLAEILKEETTVPVNSFKTIADAVNAALAQAGPDDIICAYGSLYILGQVKACFKDGAPICNVKTDKPEKTNSGDKRAAKPKKHIPIRTLCQVALLIALEIVLNRFLSFKTMGLRIGFSFVPIALCGMLYGPWYAAAAYALADILGMILVPLGPYHPGFTICAALMGITYGFFLSNKYWKKIRFFPNMVFAAVISCLVFGLFLNTIWISQLYGMRTYWEWFIYRAVSEYSVLLPLNLIFFPILKKFTVTLKKSNLV